MKNKYKLLVFDFDGTLYDNFQYLVCEYNKIADKKKLPLIENSDKLRDSNIYHIRKELKIPLRKVPNIVRRLRKKLRLTENEMLISDIKNILETLSNKYELRILSTNKPEIITKTLKDHNLLKYFKSIDVASFYFGKSRILNKIIKHSKFSNSEVLYIGDEVRDAQSCKKSKVKMLGVSWGFNSENALLKAGAIDVIDTPHELTTWL